MRHRRRTKVSFLHWCAIWFAGAFTAWWLFMNVLPTMYLKVDEDGRWQAIQFDWEKPAGRSLLEHIERHN